MAAAVQKVPFRAKTRCCFAAALDGQMFSQLLIPYLENQHRAPKVGQDWSNIFSYVILGGKFIIKLSFLTEDITFRVPVEVPFSRSDLVDELQSFSLARFDQERGA